MNFAKSWLNFRVWAMVLVLLVGAMAPAKAYACAWWDVGCHARRAAETSRRNAQAAAKAAAEAARRAAEWAIEQARRVAEEAKQAAQWVMRQTVGRLLTAALDKAGTAAGLTADFAGVAPASALIGLLDPVWKFLGLEFPRYYTWQQYTVPGAVCGNGTPYKIYVNRSMVTTKTLFVLEGGGACWNLEGCRASTTTAANPNGIRDNYLSLGSALWDLLFQNGQTWTHDVLSGIYGPLYALGGNPLMTRFHILGEQVDTQKYNMVYMPYCTGDVHGGNTLRVYSNNAGEMRVQHFRGSVNAEKVAEWAKENLGQSLECKQWKGSFAGDLMCWVGTEMRAWLGMGSDNGRMETMVVQGSSAGGFGSVLNYSTFREKLNPVRGVMIDDSGMPYDVVNPQILSAAAYEQEKTRSPFRVFADVIVNEWGAVQPDGSGHFNKMKKTIGGNIPFDENRLSSVIHAYGYKYPQDNFLYLMNRGDTTIPKFADSERRSQNKYSPDYKKWGSAGINDRVKAGAQEMDKLVGIINQAPKNVGYYFPYGRKIGTSDHTLILATFLGTQTNTTTGSVLSVRYPINDALFATGSNRQMPRVITTDTNYVDLRSTILSGIGSKVARLIEDAFHTLIPRPSGVADVNRPTIQDRNSYVISGSASLCMDASASHNGAELVLFDCHGGLNQKFSLASTGFLVDAYSNKCLVPQGEEAQAGRGIVLGDCKDQAAYKWVFFNGSFKNQAADLAITATQTVRGNRLQLQPVSPSGERQTFCTNVCTSGDPSTPDPDLVINGDGSLVNIANSQSGKCLDVFAYKTENGAQVLTWDCNGGSNQRWRYMPNGYIVGEHSGKCLVPDIDWDQIPERAHLFIWDCIDRPGFKWKYQGGKLYNLGKGLVLFTRPDGQLNMRVGNRVTNPTDELFVLR